MPLMMMDRAIGKLDLAKVMPYNSTDIMYAANPNLFFVLKNMTNQRGDRFSIEDIVLEQKEIFATKDFKKRCSDFSAIMDSRLERYFITKKSEYVFFDGEERKALEKILKQNSMFCFIDIYVRKNGKMHPVIFESLTPAKFNKLARQFDQLGLLYVVNPAQWIMMKASNVDSEYEKRREKFKEFRHKKRTGSESSARDILSEYPELNVTSKKQFNSAAKKMLAKLHPDNNQGKDTADEFMELKDKLEKLKSSLWFTRLSET